MQADVRFVLQPKEFWANVRLISERVGYSARGSDEVKVPTLSEIRGAYELLDLDPRPIVSHADEPTDLGSMLIAYFEHRARVLNTEARSTLMDSDEARVEFEALLDEFGPSCPIPMNKQKGEKRAPAFLTAIVNMLIEKHSADLPCNYDPQSLTSVTRNGLPVRTLARRVDGAFTTLVNPVAIWEIKEYYYTTSFGSRIADGVYETLLDGFELEELRLSEGVHIGHFLIVDGRRAWWKDGRPYLCRIIDMLHMGLLDEAIFGREVLARLPQVVEEWVEVAHRRAAGEAVDLPRHARPPR